MFINLVYVTSTENYQYTSLQYIYMTFWTILNPEIESSWDSPWRWCQSGDGTKNLRVSRR